MAVKIAGSPNIVITTTHTIGTASSKVLDRNKKRAGYRIKSPATNTDSIYHGHNSRVAATSLDVILPGGELADQGDWLTIYRGEVWLISGTAAQTVTVEEIVKVD